MNQTVPLSAAVRTLFLAHPQLPALIPGGLLFDLQKAGTVRPFASVHIKLVHEPSYNTGVQYIQKYELQIQVWSSQLLSDSLVLQTQLETLIGAVTKFPGLANNAKTLYCNLEPAGIDEPEERFKGQFTFVAGAKWTIQLQEFRNHG